MKKKAVVLLNMGGASNPGEIKLFLTNMFNDKNILAIPAPIRKIVAFLITRSRLNAAKANYARIGGGSPIVGHTKKLVAKLQNAIPECEVSFIMRYTPPRAETELRHLQELGIEELFLIPLYPQYSTTTTRSSLEEIDEVMARIAYNPVCHTIERFYDHPLYIETIMEQILKELGSDKAEEMDLIFSAHSLPQKVVDKGDPYETEINTHAVLLQETLEKKGIHFQNVHIAYQSKLGPVKWLEPSLEEVLEGMQNKRVLIVPLSFTIDNSETDFELAIEYREFAETHGFETYRVCRCPNESDRFVETLQALYMQMETAASTYTR